MIVIIVILIVLSVAIMTNLDDLGISNIDETKIKNDFKILDEELEAYAENLYLENRTKMNKINANSTSNPSIYEILPSLKKMGYNITIADGKIALTGLDENIKELAMEVLDEVGYDFVRENNETLNGKAPSYNNPIIPVGFKALETTDATWKDSNKDGSPDGWNNGLVIQDENGNEFVWVPVDGVNVKYEKNFEYKSNYTANSSNTVDMLDEIPDGVSAGQQITNYGGFYISRYEAGTSDGTEIARTSTIGLPQSKIGLTVWSSISYFNANASAKLLHNNSYLKSGLLTGTMWDTTCNWIENSGKNIYDSRLWGNYKDSLAPANVKGYGSRQKTGYSDYWRTKNIYDFAGNVWEWTNERVYSSYRIYRGGNYFHSGIERPANCRNGYNGDYIDVLIGFHIALFIM